MKNQRILSGFHIFIPVFVFILLLACLVVVVFSFRGRKLREIKEYKFFKFNRFLNQTFLRTVAFDEDFLMGDKDYFSFTDINGNYYLLSRFSLDHEDFQCTGSCFCEDSSRRIGLSKSIVEKKSLFFLVSAITASIAIHFAEKEFREDCEIDLSFHCDIGSIHSSVDNCEPIRSEIDDDQYELFDDKDFKRIIVEGEDKNSKFYNEEKCIDDNTNKKKRINFNSLSTKSIIKTLEREELEGKFRVLGSKKVRTRVRNHYQNELPPSLPVYPTDDIPLFLRTTGELLAKRYEQIVIGDHGAYLEISPYDINTKIIQVEPGQQWRLYHPLCKYVWYESKKGGDKIYFQKNTVRYADYQIGYYYIDPFLVDTEVTV